MPVFTELLALVDLPRRRKAARRHRRRDGAAAPAPAGGSVLLLRLEEPLGDILGTSVMTPCCAEVPGTTKLRKPRGATETTR